MPRISSPNPDFAKTETPGLDPGYIHPANTKKGHIPMAFQVTSPFNRRTLLLPHALVLHVNPMSLQETHNQKVERIQTRGGFVEQHWPHDMMEISADQSTGAFMNIHTGLTSVLRQQTIAWDKYRDLHDLFKNNGALHNPFGEIVLQGSIMLMYDKGTYLGTFRNFEWEDTEEAPFSFKLNWTFKVEDIITSADIGLLVRSLGVKSPQFQSINTAPQSTAGQDLGTTDPNFVRAGSHAGSAVGGVDGK